MPRRARGASGSFRLAKWANWTQWAQLPFWPFRPHLPRSARIDEGTRRLCGHRGAQGVHLYRLSAPVCISGCTPLTTQTMISPKTKLMVEDKFRKDTTKGPGLGCVRPSELFGWGGGVNAPYGRLSPRDRNRDADVLNQRSSRDYPRVRGASPRDVSGVCTRRVAPCVCLRRILAANSAWRPHPFGDVVALRRRRRRAPDSLDAPADCEDAALV
jgi:hypothetical protein